MVRSIILALLFFPFQQAYSQVSTISLAIQPSSTLTINGRTNISKYTCTIARYSGSDTLMMKGERGQGVTFTKGLVRLVATEFDCHVNVITKDFQETINAEEFPNIVIDFISFSREPAFQATEENFKGKLRLSLAGKSKLVEIRCAISKDERSNFHLLGHQDFSFSDFGLTPPSKMMGAVRVKETITVNFHLVVQKI
jgi:hypothetical protein